MASWQTGRPAIFSPVFAFWVVLGIAYFGGHGQPTVQRYGWLGAIRQWSGYLAGLPVVIQLAVALVPLLVLVVIALKATGQRSWTGPAAICESGCLAAATPTWRGCATWRHGRQQTCPPRSLPNAAAWNAAARASRWTRATACPPGLSTRCGPPNSDHSADTVRML